MEETVITIEEYIEALKYLSLCKNIENITNYIQVPVSSSWELTPNRPRGEPVKTKSVAFERKTDSEGNPYWIVKNAIGLTIKNPVIV